MGSNGIVTEKAVHNIDRDKYAENYEAIDWSKLRDKKPEHPCVRSGSAILADHYGSKKATDAEKIVTLTDRIEQLEAFLNEAQTSANSMRMLLLKVGDGNHDCEELRQWHGVYGEE